MPEKETYDEWKGHLGLAMAGSRSFFPHMSNDWETLVEEKKSAMDENKASCVVCLGEFDACCVDGTARKAMIVTGESN